MSCYDGKPSGRGCNTKKGRVCHGVGYLWSGTFVGYSMTDSSDTHISSPYMIWIWGCSDY